MKLFDRIEPIFNVDDEMNSLINEIDKKLNEIKINDKQKESIYRNKDQFPRKYSWILTKKANVSSMSRSNTRVYVKKCLF
jgi:hypothetical protein